YYHVQVSATINFSNLVFEEEELVELSTFLSGLSYNKTYYWRVRAVNSAGSSDWSAVRSFTTENAPVNLPEAPVLVSPSAGSVGVSLPAVLGWQPVEGATKYRVQVTAAGGSGAVVFDGEVPGTSAEVGGLSAGAGYEWRVRAVNAAGDGPWSEPWGFASLSAGEALVGHWKMDEDSGTLVSDASGRGNHGESVGVPSWVPGVHGRGIRLDGSQYVVVSDSPSLDVSGAVTVAVWLRVERTSGTQYLLTKSAKSNTDGYELSMAGGGQLFFRFNEASGGATAYRVSAVSYIPPTDGSWIHVAATYDGQTMRLYIDGELNNSRTVSAPVPIAGNSLPLSIGAQHDGSFGFRGALDDVRVYGVALGAADIRALAEVPPAPQSAPVLVSPSAGSVGVSLPAVLGW